MSRARIAAALLVCAALTGCAEARKDATTSGQRVDRAPAEVIAMPDAFRNVAHKCDGHGHRVYSASTGHTGKTAEIFVLDDPSCRGQR